MTSTAGAPAYDAGVGGAQTGILSRGAGSDFIFGSGAGGLAYPLRATDAQPAASGPEPTRSLSWATYDSGSGTLNRIDLFAGISKAQLTFVKNASDLELWVLRQSDKLVIHNWYASAANRIEEFRLHDGGKVLAAAVQGLLSAMAVFDVPAGMAVAVQMYAPPLLRNPDLFAAAV